MLQDRDLIRDATYDLYINQKRRRYSIKQMVKLLNGCLPFVRNAFGFDVALPEDEREDICKRSKKLVKTILDDEIDLLKKTDPVDDIYELGPRQEVEESRDMVEFANQALIPWYRDKEQAIEIIEDTMTQLPVWQWCKDLYGLGPLTAGKIVAEVSHDSDDYEGIAFEQFDTKYKLYKWFCVHVENGRRAQDGDHDRRAELYMVMENFIRTGDNPYEEKYRERKQYVRENRDWGKGHCDMDARMVAGKKFLADLRKAWKRLTPAA